MVVLFRKSIFSLWRRRMSDRILVFCTVTTYTQPWNQLLLLLQFIRIWKNIYSLKLKPINFGYRSFNMGSNSMNNDQSLYSRWFFRWKYFLSSIVIYSVHLIIVEWNISIFYCEFAMNSEMHLWCLTPILYTFRTH